MREDLSCDKCEYRYTVRTTLLCVVVFGVPTVRNIIILHLFYFILLPVLKVFINQMLHTFICSLCFYHLIFVKSIFDDMALTDASDSKCKECGKSFSTESDLTGHKQLHHRQQREQTMFSYEMIVILNS